MSPLSGRTPLPANNGSSTIGPNANQLTELNADLAWARRQGATNIRVNQEQVGAGGVQRVGRNRPDLQFDIGNQHYTIEYDTEPFQSTQHDLRIGANDSNAIRILKIIR